MAFDPNQQDPNQQNQQQGIGQPNLQAPPMTSSAPGAGPGASTGKGVATPQSAPAQPFQNLSAYLNANQPQVQQQANQIAGNLNNQYGQTTSAINQGKADFGNQVQAGYAAPNTDVTNAAAANPTDFAKDPNNVKAFQSLYNDQYTGPTDFESTGAYGNLSGQVSKAASDAALLGTNAGIQNYFQTQNPNATKGGNVLDSVLLQGTPEAYTTIQNAAKPFGTLQDYLTGATTEADQGVTNAQQTAQQTAQGLQNQYTGAGGFIPTFETGFNTNLNQARTTAQDKTVQEVNDFKAGNATPQELADLGTSPTDMANLKAIQDSLMKDYKAPFDTNGYINNTAPEVGITPSNFATQADYQRAAALSQLTGQDLSSVLNQTNIGQAGTAPNILSNFNSAGATGAAQNLLKQSDKALMDRYPSVPGVVPAADAQPLIDAFTRNRDSLNAAQASWLAGHSPAGGGVFHST